MAAMTQLHIIWTPVFASVLLLGACQSQNTPVVSEAPAHMINLTAESRSAAVALKMELEEILLAPSQYQDVILAHQKTAERLGAQANLHSPREIKQLATLLATEDVGKWKDWLIDTVVFYLVEHGERDTLVALLAAECPERIGLGLDIELCLALLGKDSMPDAILVLCDAFDASANPTAKARMIEALQRAFGSVCKLPHDDALIVSRCRYWYMHNRDRMTVNMEYSSNMLRGGDAYSRVPLFIAR